MGGKCRKAFEIVRHFHFLSNVSLKLFFSALLLFMWNLINEMMAP